MIHIYKCTIFHTNIAYYIQCILNIVLYTVVYSVNCVGYCVVCI